ncbi:MAG TPA: hypothetical protein VLQ45_13330 [Thermoanaerobaculia bacterium]|nr:hypothetical protein [Thermoanaerobaculia bacterium]
MDEKKGKRILSSLLMAGAMAVPAVTASQAQTRDLAIKAKQTSQVRILDSQTKYVADDADAEAPLWAKVIWAKVVWARAISPSEA